MEQTYVFGVLAAALVFFVWGKWRYDLVALGALLALVVPAIVDPERAFLGFGHPAVVTAAGRSPPRPEPGRPRGSGTLSTDENGTFAADADGERRITSSGLRQRTVPAPYSE